MAELNAGDTAPAFTLIADADKPVSLSDYAGKRVIIYFYPAAMTPGCALEAVDFNAAQAKLSGRGITVLGISPDSPEKQRRFKQRDSLTLTLLSDPEKQTARAWGVWGSKVLYGKRIEGIIRSTFVVDVAPDGQGKIALAMYNVRAKGHVDRLLAALSELP
ncbi:MAG: thioredoxin-dependent thiol peroxidase [Propionibacteriaceae bacterium]|jgi:peroxiredoxin Q/BCP|nr:thioredoxin-dependent thiol peroxidase [Propionibacteriaceae bacterium]